MKSYVCVLSTDNYLDGVLVLNENLKKINSKYPLLCLVNENISERTRDVLTYFNIKFKEMKNIEYSDSSNSERYGNYGYNKGYLKNTFDKLNIFALIEYEKLVYLDSDLLILENVDNLFDCPHLSCPKDLPFNIAKYNSGVMVLEPNMDDFLALKEASIKADSEDRKISDQDIINEYFLDKIKPLDFGYNMVREVSSTYISYFDGVFNRLTYKNAVNYFLENALENKIIHYIGKIKPFMLTNGFDDDYSYLYQYYLNIVRRNKNLFECTLQDELVSIIVPIYNKEKYLIDCLNSLCEQTYSNIEIILINDGSSDGTLDICEEFADRDQRIKIITQDNSGVSHSRNVGLKNVSGSYISFVDADDYVDRNFIKELMIGIKKYNVDFIQCGTVINENKLLYCYDRESIFASADQMILDFLMRGMSGTVWDKLYKKELLDGIYFDEEYSKNEDAFFILECVKKASSFVKIGLPLYHYSYKKDDSLTGRFSLTEDYNLFRYLDEVSDFIGTYHDNLKKYNYNFAFSLLQYMLREIDHLDLISPIDRNDKMVVEIISRLAKIYEEAPEVEELLERDE